MARDGHSTNDRLGTSRRSFVKGLGAAGVVVPALAIAPRRGFADDANAPYAAATIDWKQFAGQTITLAGAIHPWSNAISTLLPNFTELTGINVVQEKTKRALWVPILPALAAGDGNLGARARTVPAAPGWPSVEEGRSDRPRRARTR